MTLGDLATFLAAFPRAHVTFERPTTYAEDRRLGLSLLGLDEATAAEVVDMLVAAGARFPDGRVIRFAGGAAHGYLYGEAAGLALTLQFTARPDTLPPVRTVEV